MTKSTGRSREITTTRRRRSSDAAIQLRRWEKSFTKSYRMVVWSLRR